MSSQQSRSRYTKPIENLRAYILIHRGIQETERLADLIWVEEKIKAGDKLAQLANDLVDGTFAADDGFEDERFRLAAAIKGWREV